jgi:hypothetical protein
MSHEKTFRFVGDDSSDWCEVTVHVICDGDRDISRIHGPGIKFWWIYYTYLYSSLDAKAYACNPLYWLNGYVSPAEEGCVRHRSSLNLDTPTIPEHGCMARDLEEHRGGIIYQNALSDMLVKYLLMDFKSLKNLAGYGLTAQEYKGNVMESIYAMRQLL